MEGRNRKGKDFRRLSSPATAPQVPFLYFRSDTMELQDLPQLNRAFASVYFVNKVFLSVSSVHRILSSSNQAANK